MQPKIYLALFLLLLLTLMPGAVHAGEPAPTTPEDVRYWETALEQPHVPDEILVRYRTPALGAARAPALPDALASAELVDSIEPLALNRYQMEADLARLLAELNADPAVEFAEPNYLLYPDYDPNDPYYVNYGANDSTAFGGYLNRINISAAWDITRGHEAIVVAVIDTGIDLDHEDLDGAIWQNPNEIPGNGIDDDDNGLIDDINGWNFAANTPDVDDWYGHGTHVAGIIAARIDNGMGIAGVAPDVQLMPVGVFSPPGYGTFADEIEAIMYAVDQGARVINLSLGSTAYSRGEQMAVEYAVRRGVVVVAAAGNNGREVYHWPAAHDAAIAVAATTAYDTRASFSNLGDFIDIAAPGYQIISLYHNGSYVSMSGTSMAAPHVSGLAALILSKNPTLSPAEVRAIIEQTATDLGSAGWDQAFGFGRIDALAALQATPASSEPPRPVTPDWPFSQIWPRYCRELVLDGDFEGTGDAGWMLAGAATMTDTVAMSGDASLFLAGAPEQAGSASQLITIPRGLRAATLAFDLRIENDDRDLGTDPTHPGRDHLNAWLRTADGVPLLELLRGGNAEYDLAAGLPWDRYLHVPSGYELQTLRDAGQVELWFYGDNDADPYPTRFFIDNVRFCVSDTSLYLPRIFAD